MPSLEWLSSIADVDSLTWNDLANRQPSPYLRHGFLASLELSGSIAPETGWHPHHLLVWDGAGGSRALIGAAVLYLKDHSSGDFCWDFAWADAADRNGVRYYPKLVGCIPATPSGRYTFLFKDGIDRRHLVELMFGAIHDRAKTIGACSCQILFPSDEFAALLDTRVFHEWTQSRFNWTNPGHADFAAYLQGFDKNQRRNIRRERESIGQAGLVVAAIPGQVGTVFNKAETVWRFYKKTNDRFGPWAARFLNRRFFDLIFDQAGESIVLMVANRDGVVDPLAMSFLVRSDQTIFGRYWGAAEEIPNLHFELCYYAPIEWAIQNRLSNFDPGAGSPHKVRRGFLAEPERSFHHFYHEGFDKLFARYIHQFNEAAHAEIEQLNAESPLKGLSLDGK